MTAEAAPEASAEWVSVAEAATCLKTTSRSIQRGCQSGKIRARRTEGKRGQVWEIEASELNHSDKKERDSDRSATARQKSATTTATSATLKPSVALFSPDSRSKSATEERDDDSDTKERDSDGDRSQSVALELQRTRTDLERERQERTRDAEQIQFLRAMVEGLQQSEAQTKAALREALKAMPKALTTGAPEPAPIARQSPRTPANRADEQKHAENARGPQIAPESQEMDKVDFEEINSLIQKVFK
jgi:hypothetical protein